jgi:xanthine dehydrogenase accessory factor
MLKEGIAVKPGVKVGDVDPRGDPTFCRMVSDKALAVGGGVLEAVLARAEIRSRLWN